MKRVHIELLLVLCLVTLILYVVSYNIYTNIPQLPKYKVYYEYDVIHHKLPNLYEDQILRVDTIPGDTVYIKL